MHSEILFGIHPVKEAILAKRRRIFEIWMASNRTSSPRIEALHQLAKTNGIPIQMTPSDRIDALSQARGEHQGIAARVSAYPVSEFSNILDKGLNVKGASLWLLLDQITDPQNLGALLRTALCAGVTGVLIPKARSAGPTPAVSKASAGALEHIELGMVSNLTQCIHSLKQMGVWVAGLDMAGTQTIYDIDLTVSAALVLGSEGKGLRPLVKRSCDFIVSLPQIGPLGSLNAATAGGIALYEAVRQRFFSSDKPPLPSRS